MGLELSLEEQLQRHFGHSTFRPGQRETLEALGAGENVLTLMPTGAGKSLIYQFFAQTRPGLTLVLSPLIALMQDQSQKARDLGIDASFLNSSIKKEEREKRQRRLGEGSYKLFFVTPERFRQPAFREALGKRAIDLLAVDEAHCVSLWGHDFRPDYSKVGLLRQQLGSPLSVAMTATATPDVQADILRVMDWGAKSRVITTAMDRPNLSLNVESVFGAPEKLRRLQEELERATDGATIVYFSLIDSLKKASQAIGRKTPHLVYHGDLPPEIRRRNLRAFMEEKSPVVLATPAFGLGIDRPDVRRLYHLEMPGSLESYFQEVGRSGRDGLPARTLLLFDEEQDTAVQMEFLKWSHPDDQFLTTLWKLIHDRRGEVDQGGFDFLREHMSFRNRRDFRVEAGVQILERGGALAPADLPFPWEAVEEPTAALFAAEKTTERLKSQQMKLLQMLRWANDEATCRMMRVLAYFGREVAPCGVCDVCRGDARA